MASPEPRFDSEGDADDAYYSSTSSTANPSSTSTTTTDDGGSGWSGTLNEESRFDTGFALLYENSADGQRRRWFVGYARDSGKYGPFVNESGELYEASSGDTLSDLPTFSTSSDAKAAHSRWKKKQQKQSGDSSPSGGSSKWGEWRNLKELQYGWFLFGRSSSDGERAQFVVAGQRESGTTIYLADDGSIATSPVIYDSVDAVQAALKAYANNQNSIPKEKRPNGSGPSRKVVSKQVRESSTSTTKAVKTSKVVKTAKNNPALVGAAAVVGFAVLRERGGAK